MPPIVNNRNKAFVVASSTAFVLALFYLFVVGKEQREAQEKVKTSVEIINASNSAVISFKEIKLDTSVDVSDIIRRITYLKSRGVETSQIEKILEDSNITKKEARTSEFYLTLVIQKERLKFEEYNNYIKHSFLIKESLALFLCAELITAFVLILKTTTGKHLVESKLFQSQIKEQQRIYQLINHELRGLVQVLIFSISALERKGNTEKAVTRASSAIGRLLRVIEAMPTTSADEIVSMARKDLVPLCREVAAQVAAVVNLAQEIEIIVPDRPVYLAVNDALFSSAIYNLLENAVKYSSLSKRVRLKLVEANNVIIIKITDSGIGIPESEISRLFECFFRASNTGKIKGTGLGLAIVKKTIALHGGEIFVESKVGVGTTFVLTFAASG